MNSNIRAAWISAGEKRADPDTAWDVRLGWAGELSHGHGAVGRGRRLHRRHRQRR